MFHQPEPNRHFEALKTPNLFLVGAMKGGTTLLWKLLASHPSIFMSIPKEPSHFVRGDDLRRLQPYLWRQGYWKSLDRYLELFSRAKDEVVLGEASVYYSYLPMVPDVPDRIFAFNPDAQILYIMRDPIQRTISHYWHNVRYNGEYRRPTKAILDNDEYRAVSYYAMQLTPYLRRFPASRVKVLTIEEFLQAPELKITEIFRWLNLLPLSDAPALSPENETPPVVHKMSPTLGKLKAFADRSPIVRHLVETIPPIARTYIIRALAQPTLRSSIDMTDVTRVLAHLQQSQTKELSALLGRTFPEWPLTHGD